MLTLAEMLALLPDNTTGEISPADLRAVIQDLFVAANSVTQAFAYRWTTSATPATGHVTATPSWSLSATNLVAAETTDDGVAVGFGLIDSAAAARMWVYTAAGDKLTADVTGPSVDQGTYREVPVTVVAVVGNVPANNAAVTVSTLVVAPS